MKKKNKHAAAMGKIGGKNSRKNMSRQAATEMGRKAAMARWGKKELSTARA